VTQVELRKSVLSPCQQIQFFIMTEYFFSHPAIFLSSNSFILTYFALPILLTLSKLVIALLEYFVNGVCLVTVLLEYLDLHNDNKLL